MMQEDATDPYDLIAPWYDLEHHDVQDDLELYQGLAAATGGPILELGCGSGRLVVPLAQTGAAMTGVDRSATMLARCRAAVAEAGVAAHVTLVQADMTHFALPEHAFRLAFVSLGSFQHLATTAERLATLRALRAHVVPGATLALDLAQTDPRRFAQAAESGQIVHIGTWQDAATGTILTHTAAAQHGADPATLLLTHWYDTHPQGGPLTRVCIETTLASITHNEIALLLAATGWRLRQVYGDHALSEWDDLMPRLIVVAQAAE
jgi:SAM-dependent methyltransferase